MYFSAYFCTNQVVLRDIAACISSLYYNITSATAIACENTASLRERCWHGFRLFHKIFVRIPRIPLWPRAAPVPNSECLIDLSYNTSRQAANRVSRFGSLDNIALQASQQQKGSTRLTGPLLLPLNDTWSRIDRPMLHKPKHAAQAVSKSKRAGRHRQDPTSPQLQLHKQQADLAGQDVATAAVRRVARSGLQPI